MTVGTLDYRMRSLRVASGVGEETVLKDPVSEPVVVIFKAAASDFVFHMKDEGWASEDILTPEVLAEFHRASEELLAQRHSS